MQFAPDGFCAVRSFRNCLADRVLHPVLVPKNGTSDNSGCFCLCSDSGHPTLQECQHDIPNKRPTIISSRSVWSEDTHTSNRKTRLRFHGKSAQIILAETRNHGGSCNIAGGLEADLLQIFAQQTGTNVLTSASMRSFATYEIDRGTRLCGMLSLASLLLPRRSLQLIVRFYSLTDLKHI